MKMFLSKCAIVLRRLFIESEWDEMNRKRQGQGRPPIIYW